MRLLSNGEYCLSVDNRITGLRFSDGPLGFPVFCRGVSCPNLIL